MSKAGHISGLAALWLSLAAAPQALAQFQRGYDVLPPTAGSSSQAYHPQMREYAPRATSCDSSIVDHARENYLYVVRARSNNFENIQPAALGLTSLPGGEERGRVVREFVNTQMQSLMGCSNETLNRAAHDAFRDARSGGYRNDEGRFAATIMRERPDWVESYYSNAALTRLTEFVLHNRGLNPTKEQREAIINNVVRERETIVPQLVRKFVTEAMRGVETRTDVEGIIYGIASAHMMSSLRPQAAPQQPPAAASPSPVTPPPVVAARPLGNAPTPQECLRYYPEAVSAFVNAFKALDPSFGFLKREDFPGKTLPERPVEREIFLRDEARASFGKILKAGDPATCQLVKDVRQGSLMAYEEMRRRLIASPAELGMTVKGIRDDLEDELSAKLGRPLNQNEEASLSKFVSDNGPAIIEIMSGFIVDITIKQESVQVVFPRMQSQLQRLLESATPIEIGAPALKV